MAPALIPLFINNDSSSLILFYSNQSHSGLPYDTSIPSDSASTTATRIAAVVDAANVVPQEVVSRKLATSSSTEVEPAVLWVDMGFDMGYVL
jgi:hypothetical protein